MADDPRRKMISVDQERASYKNQQQFGVGFEQVGMQS